MLVIQAQASSNAKDDHSDASMAMSALRMLDMALCSPFPTEHTQHSTASAFISLAAKSQHARDAIIAAGALPWLVGFLKSDKGFCQQPFRQDRHFSYRFAALALNNLAFQSQQTAQAIIAAGAVPPLVALLTTSHPD